MIDGKSRANQTKWRKSLFSEMKFDFIVDEPLVVCIQRLETSDEKPLIWPRFTIKVTGLNAENGRFSISQSRRMGSIEATGHLERITESSTRISGEIRTSFLVLVGVIIFALAIVVYSVIQGDVSSLCFAGGGIIVIAVGCVYELIAQYYAKLSLYTFLRHLFPKP